MIAARHPFLFASLVPTIDWNFADQRYLDTRITFTRASAAKCTDATGARVTAAVNVPRFDFDAVTGRCKGLLLEDARTNLLLNSATLTTQSVTVTAAVHTLSFYGTGTVTLTGVSTAGPLVGTGVNNRMTLSFTPTAGSLNLTVSGSVTDAQLEPGAFATTHIATAGASATRAADVATVSGNNFSGWYNPAASTVVLDLIPNGLSPFGSGASFGSPGNRWLVETTRRRTQLQAGGTLEVIGTTAPVAGQRYQCSGAVSAGEVSFLSGGGALSVGANTFGMPTPNQLFIGYDGNSSTWLNGTLARLRYWPRVLSTAQQQMLTAI